MRITVRRAGASSPPAALLSGDEVRTLLSRRESSTLEFKRTQYLTRPSDHAQSGADASKGAVRWRAELIKDLLGLANDLERRVDAHLLVGVDDSGGNDGERLVGIPESRDGAEFQQVVNAPQRLNQPLRFEYHEVDIDARRVGVFTVPPGQHRFIYLLADYGHLRGKQVYIRRGATVDVASPDEVLRLGVPFHPWSADVSALVGRWFKLFAAHGVNASQIPLLLKKPRLSLEDLACLERAAGCLTEAVREASCKLFNVRRGWLEGDEPEPYEALCLDPKAERYLHALRTLCRGGRDNSLVGLRLGPHSVRSNRPQILKEPTGFLIRAEAGRVGDKTVYRYQPIANLRDWGYERHRRLAKRVLLATGWLGLGFCGYFVDGEDQLNEFCDGGAIPGPVLEAPGSWAAAWHPDDYAYGTAEGGRPHEFGELKVVLSECKLDGFLDKVARASRVVARNPSYGYLPVFVDRV